MSYKPLSQTVTDGQKNPISSDAVNDHVAAEIAAIPASANLTLSNLTAPTAVNQDLNMGTNQLRFNSANRSSSISLNALDDVATGITTSANNATTINTSGSITDVLQIGDVIYLNGLTPRAVVLTKPSATQITVSRALGDNTSREIYIEPQLLSSFNSTTRGFSVRKNGQIEVSGSVSLGINAGTLSTVDSNVTIGKNAGSALTTQVRNIYIGDGAGSGSLQTYNIGIGFDALKSQTTTGVGREGMIGVGHSALRVFNGTTSVAVGALAGRAATTATDLTLMGYRAAFNTTTASGLTLIGKSAGENITGNNITALGVNAGFNSNSGANNVFLGHSTNPLTNTTSNAIALGYGAKVESNEFGIGSSSAPILNMPLGNSSTGRTSEGNQVRIMTTKASGSDQSMVLSDLILASGQSTGDQNGSDIIFATSEAGSSGSNLNPHQHRLTLYNDGVLEAQKKIQTYGNLAIVKPGSGLEIAEGADATMGVVTLAAGTATVPTSAVASNSRIMLSIQALGTVSDPKPMAVTGRTAGTNFTITSSDNTDTSDVAWMIVNPIVYDSDAQTFFTAASITNETEKLAVSDLVKDLKKYGLWTKMKAVYPFVGGVEASCKFNLKDPQDLDASYRLVFNGVHTFASTGVTTPTNNNMTTKIAFTDFSSSQNIHLALYERTDYSDGYNAIGHNRLFGFRTRSDLSGVNANPSDFSSSTRTLFWINNGGYDGKPASGSGFFCLSKTATQEHFAWTFSPLTQFTISTRASSSTFTLTADEVKIGPGPGMESNANWAPEYSFASVGEGLNAAEIVRLGKSVEKFQRTLGRIKNRTI